MSAESMHMLRAESRSRGSKFDWPLDGVVRGSLNVKFVLSLTRLEHYASHLTKSGEPLGLPREWEDAEESSAKRKREGEGADAGAGLDVDAVPGDATEGLDSYMVQGIKALLAEAGGKGGAAAIRALVAAGVPVDGVRKQVPTAVRLRSRRLIRGIMLCRLETVKHAHVPDD
jgi:hypothetical protein